MRLPTPAPLRDAETDYVWVIVPFSRPDRLNHVLANFNRQKFPLKKLVLVRNGKAIDTGSTFYALTQSAVLLQSAAHQSAAKNTGLAEVRKRGGGFCVTMDDDDWYGPNYLTEACGYAETYDIIGKSRHFMSVDGNLWLCRREQANRKTGWLTGGTIACWAERCPEYRELPWGEDATFCMDAARRGMSIFGTDLYHYRYTRDSKQNHTWSTSAEDLRLTESARCALDLGVEDLNIVSGTRLDVECSVLAEHLDADTLAPPAPLPGESHVTP